MKKKAIVTLDIFLTFLTILTFLLFSISREKVNFSLTINKGNLYIREIKVLETKYHLKDFAKKYKLKCSKKSGLILKEKQKIDFDITKFHNIYIVFDEKKSNAIIDINYGDTITKLNVNKKTINYYYNSMSIVQLIKSKLSKFGLLEYIILVIMFFIIFVIYYYLIKKALGIIDLSIKRNLKLKSIIFIFILYSIITYFCMLPIIERINKWYIIIIIIQLALILFIYKDNLKNKMHNLFSLFAIILCVNMSVLLPPFHVPDEFSHYLKAYSIFNQNDVVEKAKIKLNNNVDNTISKYNYDLFDSQYKMSIKEYFSDFSTIALREKSKKYNFSNTKSIFLFAYIPSALVIKMVLMLKLPFIWSLIFGRLINALIFVLLGYIAIKTIPRFKKHMFLVMLFPITIQQVTAVNQDSITLSILFFTIAFLISKIDSDEKIKDKAIIAIMVLGLLIGMCKPGYFPVLLLTLLIPKDRFKSKKQCYITKILPFLVCLITTAIVMKLSKSSVKLPENSITYAYALKNPILIINLVFNTLYERLSLDFLTGQLNNFSWLAISYEGLLSFVIPYLYLTLLVFDNEGEKIDMKSRLVIFLVSLMIIGLIYASGIFSFGMTTTLSKTIVGLQPRYFIPVTLLISICCSNNFIKINYKNKNFIVAIIVIFTFAVCFYTIIKGFYL